MDRHEELAALIERYTERDGVHETPIPRAALYRASAPSEPVHGVYDPSVCIVAQGSKKVLHGDNVYVYDAATYLVVSVDVPIIGHVAEATREKPYLCLKLTLDVPTLSALVLETGLSAADDGNPGPSLALSATTPELLDAAIRFVKLMERPSDIPILAPLTERELLYRLLTGAQGARLKQIALGDSKLSQINRAIGWIKRNYREPFSVERAASEARMSLSAFHQHFKAVTSMSPLQYQKQLRLQEARRLILAAAMDAASAGHSVGYESPSQFSREYARLFGAPPLRDVSRLRQVPSTSLNA